MDLRPTNLLSEVGVPLAKLPVLRGESLSSSLQLDDVDLQLSGVVPGDLQLAARLLSMGPRTLPIRERDWVMEGDYEWKLTNTLWELQYLAKLWLWISLISECVSFRTMFTDVCS